MTTKITKKNTNFKNTQSLQCTYSSSIWDPACEAECMYTVQGDDFKIWDLSCSHQWRYRLWSCRLWIMWPRRQTERHGYEIIMFVYVRVCLNFWTNWCNFMFQDGKISLCTAADYLFTARCRGIKCFYITSYYSLIFCYYLILHATCLPHPTPLFLQTFSSELHSFNIFRENGHVSMSQQFWNVNYENNENVNK